MKPSSTFGQFILSIYWFTFCHMNGGMECASVTLGIILDNQLHNSSVMACVEQHFQRMKTNRHCPQQLPELAWLPLNSSDRFSFATSVSTLANAGLQGVVSVLTPPLQNKLVYAMDSIVKLPHVAVGLGRGQPVRSGRYTIYTSPDSATEAEAMIDVLDDVIRENGWKTITFLQDRICTHKVQKWVFHLSKSFVETRLWTFGEDDSDYQLYDKLRAVREKGSKTFFVLAEKNLRNRLISQANKLNMLGYQYYWMFHTDDTPLHVEMAELLPLRHSNVLVLKRHWKPYRVCCSPDSETPPISDLHSNHSVMGMKLLEGVALLERAIQTASRTTSVDVNKPSSDDVMKQFYRETTFSDKSWFDEKGNPRRVRYDLYSMSKLGNSPLIYVGKWTDGLGVTLHKRFFLNKFVDFGGEEIQIAALEQIPYYMNTSRNGEYINTGLCMDILDELGKRLKFSYRIIQPADAQYGVPDGPLYNATWNGMVGMVINGETHMAAGPFTVTSDRATVVEFSKSYMEISLTIISKKINAESNNLFQVFKPFSVETWCSLGAVIVIVGLTSAFINRCSPSRAGATNPILSTFEESIVQNIWTVYSGLMEQGPIFHPSSISGRYILCVWWIFCTLVVSMYTAVLAAFLTVSSPVSNIDSLTDLVNHKDVIPLLARGSNSYSLFRDSKIPTYQEVWRQSLAAPVVQRESEAVDQVGTGRYAFISDSRGLEFIASGSCNRYHVAKERFNKGSYAFILPKEAPYVDAVNFNIMKILEAGLVEAWWEKWTKQNEDCPDHAGDDQRKLKLNRLGGVFIIYILLLAVATFLFLCNTIGARLVKSR